MRKSKKSNHKQDRGVFTRSSSKDESGRADEKYRSFGEYLQAKFPKLAEARRKSEDSQTININENSVFDFLRRVSLPNK